MSIVLWAAVVLIELPSLARANSMNVAFYRIEASSINPTTIWPAQPAVL